MKWRWLIVFQTYEIVIKIIDEIKRISGIKKLKPMNNLLI